MGVTTIKMSIKRAGAIPNRVSIAQKVAALFGSPQPEQKPQDDRYDFSKRQNQKNYLNFHQDLWR